MTKQYYVGVQQKYHQADGTYLNLAKIMRGISRSYYTSLDLAMSDLKRFVESKNQGARTETQVVNGIGIDFVIDAESAANLAVVDWFIKVREVTPWELVAKK